jgi:pyridoxine 4-dehydrogenase
VLEECHARGIAFVPFFPLGSGFAQVALAWLLDLRPEVLLIPGTSSISHLEENLAVSNIELDAEARDLLGEI